MKQTTILEFEDDDTGNVIVDLSEDDWKRDRRDDGEGGDAALAVASQKVATIVRHITGKGVMHDYADILAEGVDGVLEMYTLAPVLDEEEREKLRGALLELGGRQQTREIVRHLAEADEPLIGSLTERDWTARQEQAFTTAYMKLLRARAERVGAGKTAGTSREDRDLRQQTPTGPVCT